MAMSRQRWFARLIPFVGFSIVAAVASQADAAVTSCETNALTNANFEEATVDGKAALWCDSWGRGYSRVLVTPAKYNYAPIVSIPLSVPAAERAAGAYQIVNLNQTQAKNVFVGAMVKGSNIVLDPDELGQLLTLDSRWIVLLIQGFANTTAILPIILCGVPRYRVRVPLTGVGLVSTRIPAASAMSTLPLAIG